MDLKKPQANLNATSTMSEVILRVLIWSAFIFMELLPPFVRVIQPEEMYLYKYPYTGFQYVPASLLWVVSVIIPIIILSLDRLRTKNRYYYRQGMLSLTLLLGLNGFLTVLLKNMVGRPRPDFYYRCWPEGTEDLNAACTGDAKKIQEGRKSFPSGHASFSFAGMMFLSCYLAGRLQTFDKCRGQAWRLIATGFPLLIALGIAVSRTCDYHHHWQDVVCGALIGISLAYVCYHQYFPSFTPFPCNGTTTTKTTTATGVD